MNPKNSENAWVRKSICGPKHRVASQKSLIATWFREKFRNLQKLSGASGIWYF